MKVVNGLLSELTIEDETNLFIPADAVGFAEDCSVNHPGLMGTLKSIKVEKGNPVFYVVNKCLMHKDGTLYAAARGAKMPEDGSVKHIHRGVFNMHPLRGELRIPEGVESIRELAFGSIQCEKIYIPASVKWIAGAAFFRPLIGKISAERKNWEIVVDEKNKYYYTQGGCLIDRRKMAVVASFGREIVIPDGVKRIEQGVLGFARFNKLVIPASVKFIDKINFVGTCGSKIFVEKDSYAEKFLKKHGYALKGRTYSYV